MNLTDFKSQYPQYAKVPDGKLADALHAKYYSSLPKDEFYKKIGYNPTPDVAGGMKEAASKGQVYVEALPGLSQKETASLYAAAEGASSTIRGLAQIAQEHFPSLEKYMPDSFKQGTIEEQVRIRQALENSPEYKKSAITGQVAGTIADPITYILPLGKATTLRQFIKMSALSGAFGGFTQAKTAEESRGKAAVIGAGLGGLGGAVLGTVMRVGGKMFGKDWLPLHSTPEEDQKVAEEIAKKVAPEHQEEVAKETNYFLKAKNEEDHVNAKNTAEDLLTRNASKKEVEKITKKNPLVKTYIDEYANRYQDIKESSLGITKQGEVLPPETQYQAALESKAEGESAQKALTELDPKLPSQSGVISPQLAANLAGAGIGALVDPNDPTTGAILGLAAAHGGMKALEMFQSRGMEKAIADTAPDVLQGARKMIGDSVNNIASRFRNNFNVSNRITSLLPEIESRERVTAALDGTLPVGSLSSEEKQAYEAMRTSLNDLGKRALEAGVIKEMRANYISHLVDFAGDKGAFKEAIDHLLGTPRDVAGAARSTSKFGKQRTYDTIADLEAAGLKVKTKDASQIYKIYADSVERAIIGKNLVKDLSNYKFTDGKSILIKLGKDKSLPYGWKVNPVLPGYAVHPDIAPILEHMFTSYSPGAIVKGLSALTNAVKRLNVTGTFFHAWNLYGSMLLSAPKVAIKQLNPMDMFGGVRRAAKMFRDGGLGDQFDSALKNGLVVEVPIDVEKQIFSHIGTVVDSGMQKLGFGTSLEKLGKGAEKYAFGIPDKVTWDFMHTGGKYLVYQHLLDQAKIKNPSADETELGREIAKFVNGAFGGLNWTGIAADSSNKLIHELTNPRSRATMALAEFAPDWTLSTVGNFFSAFVGKNTGLKGVFNPVTKTDLSRRYLFHTAVAYFTLMNGLNTLTSGRPIWENYDPTRIEFKDGTSMQIAKHAMEPYEWLLHPEKTLANKMAFLPRAALLYWGERQYPFGPDLEDKSAAGKMAKIGEMALPFQASSAIEAPKGEKLSRIVSGTIGIPMYGMTTSERREARRQRAKLKMKLHKEIYQKLHKQ